MSSQYGLRVFSGTAHPALTEKICGCLDIPVGRASVDRFPDGETLVRIEDDVRGRDCFLVQPTSHPVNHTLMELLIFIDCLARASDRRITARLPYFGYARQDRKSEGRTPITAKLVANLMVTARVNRVLAIDLHAEQVQGFFDIPVDHLTAEPVLLKYFRKSNLSNIVVVSPDVGNVKTANVYAQDLGADLAVIDKRRVSGIDTVATRIIGNVQGKDVLMFDDMITTAGTICSAARMVRENGAKSVRVAATHGIFAPPAVDRLNDISIDEVVVADTVPLSEESKKIRNLKVLTVAELLGKAIHRIHNDESVSEIFEKQ